MSGAERASPAGPFSVNLVDFIQNDLEEAFKELVSDPDSGVTYIDEEESYYIQFFNPVGDAEELSFRTLSELFHNIVGIRFVQMNNRIVKRKPYYTYQLNSAKAPIQE